MPSVRSRFAPAVAVAFALARPALAQQTVGMRYERPATGASYNGYYVGPNVGTMFPAAGNPGQGKTVTMFCVDFLNEVTFNQTWTANVSPLAGSALGLTREPTGLDGYRRAVWLADQFARQDPQYWGGIQSAIWAIFGSPGFDGNPVKTAQQLPVASDAHNAAYWSGQANAFAASSAFGSYDYSRYAVITATGAAGLRQGGGPQEFITQVQTQLQTQVQAVPEPAPLALVVAGAGAVVVVRRRRRA